MCMSLGCAACGVTGCRIIDSPRERLVASLTACLVPLQREISHPHCPHHHVFVGGQVGLFPSLQGAALLLGTLLVGWRPPWAAQAVVLYGAAGSPLILYLELPPLPQATGRPGAGALGAGSDSFVLGRAAAVAARRGGDLVDGQCAGGRTVSAKLVHWFLDPFRPAVVGLDGVILMAFLLGWPANEIVVPVMLMAYLSTDRWWRWATWGR